MALKWRTRRRQEGEEEEEVVEGGEEEEEERRARLFRARLGSPCVTLSLLFCVFKVSRPLTVRRADSS